jgi:hypothetical protein
MIHRTGNFLMPLPLLVTPVTLTLCPEIILPVEGDR